MYEELQSLDIDLIDLPATEKVGEHALCQRVFVLDGVLPPAAREGQHRLDADPALLAFELLQRPRRLWHHTELHHIQHLSSIRTHPGQRVWAFLAVTAEEEQAGVVFLGEEFQAGGVFERVDRIFLVELNAVRLLQRM